MIKQLFAKPVPQDAIPIFVNGNTYYGYWLKGYTTKRLLIMTQKGDVLGSKDFGHLNDEGERVLQYAVKSLLAKN